MSGVEQYEAMLKANEQKAEALAAERDAWRAYLRAERDTLRYDRRQGPSTDRGEDERRSDVIARRALDEWQGAERACRVPPYVYTVDAEEQSRKVTERLCERILFQWERAA